MSIVYPFFFFSISTGKEKERVPQEKEKPRFLPEWLVFASQKASVFCRHMIISRTIFIDNNMTNDGHFQKVKICYNKHMINYTDYIKLIEEKLKEKKYEEVIKLANSALENDIDKPYLYYKYIGQAEFYLANYNNALENFEMSLEINSTQQNVYYELFRNI